ncbi:site-2 protease family protein [Paenibacillus sp. TAB 01]|uniref:site-2 protease family protein n=1 Tax=Paenibacillus sp. TAB 01 TaxID=3368988 RepID=UPI0037528A64
MGRLTLNPRAHVDWLGMIFFLIIGIGWARPVLVNRSRFKKPRIMGILVSLAGSVSNLILGFISIIILYLLQKNHVLGSMSTGVQMAIQLFLTYMVMQNIFLFILNLIPLPPLDGYRIVEDLLPRPWLAKVKEHEQWLFYVILLMFFIQPIRNVTLGPIFAWQWDILNAFNYIVSAVFGK